MSVTRLFACADIIAFLVDAMLDKGRLKLFPENVKSVLRPYKFDTTVLFFDSHSKNHCAWQVDEVINISSRLAKPIIFLAMDPLIAESGSQEHDTQMSQDVRATDKPRRTDVTLRQTEAYQTALKYAYQKNGCMKLFSAHEDRGLIRSGDVFIYVGPKSEKNQPDAARHG